MGGCWSAGCGLADCVGGTDLLGFRGTAGFRSCAKVYSASGRNRAFPDLDDTKRNIANSRLNDDLLNELNFVTPATRRKR